MPTKRTKPTAPQETTQSPAQDAAQEEPEILTYTPSPFYQWLMDAAESLKPGNSKPPVISDDGKIDILIDNLFFDNGLFIDVVEKISCDLLYYPDMKETEGYQQTDTPEKVPRPIPELQLPREAQKAASWKAERWESSSWGFS
jgi:hypothetical protein